MTATPPPAWNDVPTPLERALGELLLHLDEHLESTGWEQPATLWAVVPVDLAQPATTDPDRVDAACTTDTDTVQVSFGVRPLAHLGGNPVDALIGHTVRDRTVLGVVLVCEGWAYSDQRRHESPTLPPHAYPDRVEVRTLTLVLRDASEVMLHRPRHGEPTLIAGDALFDGRAFWHLRRVLEVPSGAARLTELPTPEQIRRRAMLAVLIEVLPLVPPHETQEAAQAVAAALDASLSAPDWEGERHNLLIEAQGLVSAGQESGGFDELATHVSFLEWADGELVAAWAQETAPTDHDLASGLWSLVLSGQLTPAAAAQLARPLGLTPPAGEWSSAPPGHQSCPCGSGRQFASCHQPR